MPMKRKSALLLLPLLLLSSCGEKVDFSYTDDPELIYLTRNGDNKGSTSNKLNDFVRLSNASELVSRISSGESVFVYAYQFGCASCAKVEEAMTAYLRDSLVTCYGLYDDKDTRSTENSVIKKAFDALKKSFPALAETIGDAYRTPTGYLIKNKETIYSLTFSYDKKEDPIEFEKKMKGLINYTSIYEFKTAPAFLEFAEKNDCFYVYDDKIATSGIFMEKVYSRAIHSSKPTARIQYSYLSSEDKALLAARLGSGSADNFGFISKGKYQNGHYKDNESAFLSALDIYYGKQEVETSEDSGQASSASTSASASSSEASSNETTSA